MQAMPRMNVIDAAGEVVEIERHGQILARQRALQPRRSHWRRQDGNHGDSDRPGVGAQALTDSRDESVRRDDGKDDKGWLQCPRAPLRRCRRAHGGAISHLPQHLGEDIAQWPIVGHDKRAASQRALRPVRSLIHARALRPVRSLIHARALLPLHDIVYPCHPPRLCTIRATHRSFYHPAHHSFYHPTTHSFYTPYDGRASLDHGRHGDAPLRVKAKHSGARIPARAGPSRADPDGPAQLCHCRRRAHSPRRRRDPDGKERR